MNCIWLLLILFCCGNNGCGNTWSNSCGNNNWNWGRNNCSRCGDNCDNDNYSNRRNYDNDDSVCENVCEAACEAARDAVRESSDQGCGCRRSFPFTSYPVLNDCD